MNRRYKLLSIVLTIAMVLSLVMPIGAIWADSSSEKTITVLGTSDMHGRIFPWEYATASEKPEAGFGKIQTLVKQEKAINPNAVLIDIGDTVQDNMAELFNNKDVHPMVEAMNYMGYDTWTLGNHEFNFGMDFLNKNIAAFKGSVIAANIYKEDGTRFAQPYAIIEKDGIRIAVVGIVPPHIPTWEASTPEHFKGLKFTDPVEEAKKVVQELAGKYDVLVGAFHMGDTPEYGTTDGAIPVAEACPEFDVIFCGHKHSKFDNITSTNGVKLIETGSYGAALGKAEIKVEKIANVWTVKEVTTKNLDTKEVAVDKELLEKFAYVDDTSKAEADKVVGEVTEDFIEHVDYITGADKVTTMPTSQLMDTPVVDLINDVQTFYAGADISSAALFKNDSNLKKGAFQKKNVAFIYMYDNTLMGVNITGKNLKVYMEWSASYYNTFKDGDLTVSFNPNVRGYNYDMFSGVTYKVDISKNAGGRIADLLYKGQPIEDEKIYKLAVNNYRFGTLLSNGWIKAEDKYFDSYAKYQDAGRVRDLIVKYVQENKGGKLSPSVDNNWSLIGTNFDNTQRDAVIAKLKSGELKIPASEDGRTLNVKAVNIYDLISKGVLKGDVITIVHTNDTHGRVFSSKTEIGFGKIGTKVKEIRNNFKNVLVLDAGDTFHGQTIASLVKGESIAKVMNTIRYDAMSPGNHDFNYGQERLLELDKMTDFPILAANITNSKGKAVYTQYIIKDVGGYKVGIFGLATPETLYKTNPNNIKGLKFNDPVKTAENMVKELKAKNVDVIIALSHLGLDGSSTETSKLVAEKVKGINLIVDGHSHTILSSGLKVGDTLIVQAGEYDKNLGIANIVIDNGKITLMGASLINVGEVEKLEEDKDVLAVVDSIKAEQDKITTVVVGKVDVVLEGTREKVRAGETNLGNLITDAMMKVSGADVAITNGGGIRASIDVGDITRGEVITVLPFGNYVVAKMVKGSDIVAALENGVSKYPDAHGAFPHVGGIRFNFDSTKEAGQRVGNVWVNGLPIDNNKLYKLATNDFMAAGGDLYESFKAGKVIGEYPGLDEIVIDYIAKYGTANTKVDGRVGADVKPTIIDQTYEVKSGDFLWKIANKFGLTIEAISEVNSLTNIHMIFPGQKLIIPVQ